MGAPSPELVDLWLARVFNAQDIEAAAAMYHPDARVVRLQHVHGSDSVAQGAEEIRETMVGYVGLKPHMDVVVHHTTVAGDFALCRSQWRITGTLSDNGNTITGFWEKSKNYELNSLFLPFFACETGMIDWCRT